MLPFDGGEEAPRKPGRPACGPAAAEPYTR
jgi:hypothetical protein